MEELKPCPFCGGKEIGWYRTLRDKWALHCSNMKCAVTVQTDEYEAPQEAINAWNRRYTEDDLK